MAVPSSSLEGVGETLASHRSQALRLERSQFALFRFIAGIRTLFALLAGIGLLSHGIGESKALAWVVLAYLLLSTALLVRTLGQWPQAGAARWLWIDAATVAIVCRLAEQDAPSLGI